jgi:dephospho-CoA kinase
MKKNLVTYGLIAAGVAAVIILMRKSKKSGRTSVFADSPIRQSQAEYEADYAEVVEEKKPSILETAGTLIKTIFPKKTEEQKAAKKATKLAKKTARKEKRAARKVAGIDDQQCLY